MEQPDYIQPGGRLAPQLSKADLDRLSAAEITAADNLGQFEIIQTGRDPLPFEINGERRATDTEDAQARADQAEAQRVAATQQRNDLRAALKEK